MQNVSNSRSAAAVLGRRHNHKSPIEHNTYHYNLEAPGALGTTSSNSGCGANVFRKFRRRGASCDSGAHWSSTRCSQAAVAELTRRNAVVCGRMEGKCEEGQSVPLGALFPQGFEPTRPIGVCEYTQPHLTLVAVLGRRPWLQALSASAVCTLTASPSR